MAKISKIYVEYGQTVGMPGFSSASCKFGYEVTLDAGDDPQLVRRNLINYVKDNVNNQIRLVESEFNKPAWKNGGAVK